MDVRVKDDWVFVYSFLYFHIFNMKVYFFNNQGQNWCWEASINPLLLFNH